jgi:hypothetical protein
MFISLAGKVAGNVPDGMHLYLLRNSDEGSYDSTPEHHRGTVDYFSIGKLQADSNGCWLTDRRELGYSGARGLLFHYTFALIPEDSIFEAEQGFSSKDGLQPENLDRLRIVKLAVFDVKTST